MEYLTNVEVARKLGVSIEDTEALGDELGVYDDAWTDADVEAAEELLEDEEDEDSEDGDVDEDVDEDDELDESGLDEDDE